MNVSPMKHASAWVPIGMSLAALATVLIHITLYGTAREADEGTAAHIWQLLMAGQLPVVAFFALKWLPRAPRSALEILSLQFAAGFVALFSVYWFGL